MGEVDVAHFCVFQLKVNFDFLVVSMYFSNNNKKKNHVRFWDFYVKQ